MRASSSNVFACADTPESEQERSEVESELFLKLLELTRVLVAYNHNQSRRQVRSPLLIRALSSLPAVHILITPPCHSCQVLLLLNATLQQVVDSGMRLFRGGSASDPKPGRVVSIANLLRVISLIPTAIESDTTVCVPSPPQTFPGHAAR
jgi:hypothetical protein